MHPGTFWLSLLAALLYALGVLLLKRSTHWNPGVWRSTLVCNLMAAAAFQPLLLLGGTIPSALALWQPAVVALLFIGGQIFTLLALTRGDVSVATPMLGLKILLVALLAWLLMGHPLPAAVWSAAALATVAVALLSVTRSRSERRRVGFTAACSLAAAAAYALFDVLVQQWSPVWGIGRFLPITFAWTGVLSLVMIVQFPGPLWQIHRSAWPWLGAGGMLIAAQALVFVSTIASWGHAPAANVVYSSRGLWAVVLVWVFGRALASEERDRGRVVLVSRLLGAMLLTAAIFLIL